MKALFFLSLSFCMLISTFTFSQAPQNAREAVQDQHQIRRDQNMLARDRQELAAFDRKRKRIYEAWKTGDIQSVRILKKELLKDMDREIAQARAWLNQTQAEVHQSKKEVEQDKAELARDRRDARHPRGDALDDARDLHRDRHDKRDDQRDLADDKGDRNQAAKRLNRMTEIRDQLLAYEFILNGAPGDNPINKLRLLDEFQHIMENQVNALARELGEDIRESKEDARERRDDRRERREKY